MNAKKLLVIPALFIALGMLAQEANLTMKPVAKSKYNLEINSQVNVTQSMAGMEMKVNASSDAKAVMEIDEVASNGNFTTLTTWKEIKTTSSAMGVDTTMNFDNLNLVMKTVYDKSGKIIKNERVSASESPEEVIAMAEQMASGMKFHILPTKVVVKGDSWTNNTNDTISMAQMGMQMISSTEDKYTFAGTETKDGAEYYRVNITGPAKVSGEGSQMGMDMTIEGTGMNEGYSLLDKKTLLPVEMSGNLGLDMSVIVSGPQSMAIPMTQNVITKIVITEVR